MKVNGVEPFTLRSNEKIRLLVVLEHVTKPSHTPHYASKSLRLTLLLKFAKFAVLQQWLAMLPPQNGLFLTRLSSLFAESLLLHRQGTYQMITDVYRTRSISSC